MCVVPRMIRAELREKPNWGSNRTRGEPWTTCVLTSGISSKSTRQRTNIVKEIATLFSFRSSSMTLQSSSSMQSGSSVHLLPNKINALARGPLSAKCYLTNLASFLMRWSGKGMSHTWRSWKMKVKILMLQYIIEFILELQQHSIHKCEYNKSKNTILGE